MNTKTAFYRFFLLTLIFFSPLAAKEKKKPQPDLTVAGFLLRRDGIGRQSVEIIDTFKNELSIGFIHTRQPVTDDIPTDILKITNNLTPPGKVLLFEDLIWSVGHDAYRRVMNIDREKSIVIAYSMLESSAIPYNWVRILNSFFDAVAVPDKYLADVYKNTGVKIPIFVLPLSVNLTTFLNSPIKEKKHDVMTFGNMNICEKRKNLDNLMLGFAKAFGDNPNFRLVINCRWGDPKEIERLLVLEQKLDLKNIELTFGSLDNRRYLNKFREFDCYVNVAKGEGFAIQPREAMALGIPAIVSNATAQKTICESNLVLAVNAIKEVQAYYPTFRRFCGMQYEASAEDIAEAMLEMAQNYDKYLARNHQARNWASQYTNENLKPLYRALIKPYQIVLGKGNFLNANVLTTNSKELYEKYRRIVKNQK